MPASAKPEGSNIDRSQIEHFAQSPDWRDPDGSWRALHDINPARLEFIERAVALAGLGAGLKGLNVLDLGCGGGILSVEMAAAGARVHGVDAEAQAIEQARRLAAERDLDVKFTQASADALEGEAPSDVLVCCELLEHVPDPERLLKDCARLARPGGAVVLSTLTRSLASFAGAIVAAEYLLNIVPRGTHRHADFIRPSELVNAAEAAGLELLALSGLDYSPFTRQARLEPRIRINYLAAFRRR